MRSTSGSRTVAAGADPATLPRADRTTGTTRRTASTGGVSRPSSLGSVAPRDKRSTGGTGSRAAIGTGGWKDYQKENAERTQKYPTLDVKDDPVVIKFAEAEPFAYIFRHWVAKRPYTCIGEDCPLCEAGHRAKPVVYYNVITVVDNTLRVWEMSSDPTKKVHKQYERLASVDKTLDAADTYFVVSKEKQTNGVFAYDLVKVKAADLAEDAGQEPLSAAEIADATKRGLFTDEIIYVNSKDDLREAAEKLSDED
jgi:hypothetical protein